MICRVSGHEKLCNTCDPSGLVNILSPEVMPVYMPVILSILAAVDTSMVGVAVVLFLQQKQVAASNIIIDRLTLKFMWCVCAKIENMAA